MMKMDVVYELYELISRGSLSAPSRRQTMKLRRFALASASNDGFKKLAFDTRKIDQETDYIPRRGLQNYHRSEKFVSDKMASKVEAFAKLGQVLNQLKAEYGREPEWQDSYARVLASTIQKSLRTEQLDGDFSESQPSMASLDYLEELMYVRYRLTPDNLMAMSEQELRTVILNKDELLVRKGMLSPAALITPHDVTKYSYDGMVEKMLNTMSQTMTNFKVPQPDDNLTNKLFNVKATPDSPEIERTVTITIKDKIVDRLESQGDQSSEKKTGDVKAEIKEE